MDKSVAFQSLSLFRYFFNQDRHFICLTQTYNDFWPRTHFYPFGLFYRRTILSRLFFIFSKFLYFLNSTTLFVATIVKIILKLCSARTLCT